MEQNKYDGLKLSKQLCFPLYACARETIKLYTPHLDRLGLTYTQYITMMVLWERRSLTAKELGRILYNKGFDVGNFHSIAPFPFYSDFIVSAICGFVYRYITVFFRFFLIF